MATLQWYTIEYDENNIVTSVSGIDKPHVDIEELHETFFRTNYDEKQFKSFIWITKHNEVVEFAADKIQMYFIEYKMDRELMIRLKNKENILAYLSFIDI